MNRKGILLQVTLFCCFILSICGCITIYNPATCRNEFYFIDENTEIAIGRNLANQILREEKIVRDKKVISYVEEIGKKVARVSHRSNLNYHFYVVDDEEINAFALPGGYVFVNKGLIDKTNRDELAFCIGHEIGHICARHSLKKLQASLGFSLVLSLALGKPEYVDIRKALDIVYKLISLGYSRQDELLADRLGILYAYRAGFNPYAALTLFEKLKKEGETNTFVFLSSHPPVSVRIDNAKKVIKKLQND